MSKQVTVYAKFQAAVDPDSFEVSRSSSVSFSVRVCCAFLSTCVLTSGPSARPKANIKKRSKNL